MMGKEKQPEELLPPPPQINIIHTNVFKENICEKKKKESINKSPNSQYEFFKENWISFSSKF